MAERDTVKNLNDAINQISIVLDAAVEQILIEIDNNWLFNIIQLVSLIKNTNDQINDLNERLAALQNQIYQNNRRQKVYKFYNIINKKDKKTIRLLVIALHLKIIEYLAGKNYIISRKENVSWITEEDLSQSNQVLQVYNDTCQFVNNNYNANVSLLETMELYEKIFIKYLKEGYVVTKPQNENLSIN